MPKLLTRPTAQPIDPAPVTPEIPPPISLSDHAGYGTACENLHRLTRELSQADQELATAVDIARRTPASVPGAEMVVGLDKPPAPPPDVAPLRDRVTRLQNALALQQKVIDRERMAAQRFVLQTARPQVRAALLLLRDAADALRVTAAEAREIQQRLLADNGLDFLCGIDPDLFGENSRLSKYIERLDEVLK